MKALTTDPKCPLCKSTAAPHCPSAGCAWVRCTTAKCAALVDFRRGIAMVNAKGGTEWRVIGRST